MKSLSYLQRKCIEMIKENDKKKELITADNAVIETENDVLINILSIIDDMEEIKMKTHRAFAEYDIIFNDTIAVPVIIKKGFDNIQITIENPTKDEEDYELKLYLYNNKDENIVVQKISSQDHISCSPVMVL